MFLFSIINTNWKCLETDKNKILLCELFLYWQSLKETYSILIRNERNSIIFIQVTINFSAEQIIKMKRNFAKKKNKMCAREKEHFHPYQWFSWGFRKRHKSMCTLKPSKSFDLTIMSEAEKLYKNGYLCWFYVQSCCLLSLRLPLR